MSDRLNELRKKAHLKLNEVSEDEKYNRGTDIKSLVEELSIYQIELEQQNQELRESQEQLSQSKKEFENLFENAPMGYIVISSDGIIIRANNTFRTYLETDIENIIGSHILRFVDSNYQKSFEMFITSLKKKLGTAHAEFKFITPKKTSKYFKIDAVHANVSYSQQDLWLSLSDITQRKVLENELHLKTNELKESEQRFRQIVENSNDIFFYQSFTLDRLEYVSPKIFDILGFTPQEIINMNHISLISQIPPEFRFEITRIKKNLSELFSEKNYIIREFPIYRKDNIIVWFKASFTLVKDIEDNPSHILGTLQDITKRKEYEDNLISAKEKAKESDRLKTAFLNNMSHEIRTPMNAIVGFSSFLKKQNLDKTKQDKFVDIIVQSSNHLLNLIDDILEISGIEAGKTEIKNSKLELNSFLKELFLIYKEKIKADKTKSIILSVFIPEKENFILTDKTKLNRILINLLENSLKFTEKGSIEFGYKIIENKIHFFVKDTGIGISKHKQVIIFDRFIKASDKTDKLYGGTGLGLSIVKACVAMLGGQVIVNSELDKGAEFKFNINYTPFNEKVNPEIFESNYRFSGQKILIAEDDDVNYMLFVEYLSNYNLKTCRAKTGKETIKKALEDDEIKIILLDIKMPEMDGLEALKEIRKERPELIVIAQTANIADSDELSCLNAGCDDFLSKPIEQKKLIDALQRNIKKRV